MYTKLDIIKFKRALRRLLKRSGALFDEYGFHPLRGSKAYSEQIILLNDIEIQTALSAADALIESAGDHIYAFCKAITEPAVTMAPWTCVRGTLEASAIACWLMDPSIDGVERLRRSFAYRYHGLVEQKKYFSSIGNQISINAIERRIDTVEIHAFKFGFPKLLNKSGKRKGIGQVMPTNTSLIKSMFNREHLYRLSSAMAHGQNWALKNLAYKATNEKHVFEKDSSLEAILYLIIESAYVFSFSVWYKAILFGWDQDRLIIIFKSAWKSFGIKNEDYKFWNRSIF